MDVFEKKKKISCPYQDSNFRLSSPKRSRCTEQYFMENGRFITAFTSARHLSLSWATSIHSIPPHPTSWRYIIILSSHLRLGLSSDLLPSGSPTKCLYTTPFYPIRATCPANLILIDFITRAILGAEYRSLSSSLCCFLHSPVTSSLLGPNILFSTLFSNTLSLRSSLNVCDQASHPYKTTGKIIVLYMECHTRPRIFEMYVSLW